MGKFQEQDLRLLKRRTHAITGEGKHHYRFFADLQRPGVLIFQCVCGDQQGIRRSLMARIVTGKIGMMTGGFVHPILKGKVDGRKRNPGV